MPGGLVEFSILGPVQIRSSSTVAEPRGPFQSALLGALLVAEGRQIHADALIHELWEEGSPRNAMNALQAHISRLRRKLDAVEPGGGARLVSRASGYVLQVAAGELDATRFVRTVAACDSPLLPLAEKACRLREALGWWRAPVFGGIPGGPICRSAAVRYEEARSVALGLLYDAELARGRHTEIIAELVELAERDGFNERLCEQLMVALYRAGRQTDALAVYRRMRCRLADELGIEPSPSLQKYQQAILAQDPALRPCADHLAVRA